MEESERVVATLLNAELVGPEDSLVLRGIKKSFGGVEALRGASLTCRCAARFMRLLARTGPGRARW